MNVSSISSCLASMLQITLSFGDIAINGENSLAALAVVGAIALLALLLCAVVVVVWLVRTKR